MNTTALLLSEKVDPPAPWEERTVFMYGHKFQAATLGSIAVHRSTVQEGYWVVSALPCKDVLIYLRDRDEALKMGMALRSNFYVLLKGEDPAEVRRQFPQWAYKWVHACRDQGKCLDSQPYEEVVE